MPTNGLEGFWSYAKPILYYYRSVSKYQFPLDLKEKEYRFNPEPRIYSNDSGSSILTTLIIYASIHNCSMVGNRQERVLIWQGEKRVLGNRSGC